MAQLASVEDGLEAKRALEAESEDDFADRLDTVRSSVGTKDVDIVMGDVGARRQPSKKRTGTSKVSISF